jgi:uncharacterized protein (TIGR03118 family)
MKPNLLSRLWIAGMLGLALATTVASAKQTNTNSVPKTNSVSGFVEVDLVSSSSTNSPTNTTRLDTRLVNAWGLIAGPGLIWVNANGSGLLLTYRPSGGKFKGSVRVPSLDGTNNGAPTGLVQNNSFFNFVVTNGTRRAPAQFVIATEDGTIAAWSQFVTRSDAVIVADRSISNSVYKGLAIATLPNGTNGINAMSLFFGTNGAPQLYATDFHNGMVDVFDRSFQYVQSFTDINAPTNFAPFGIRNINGNLFVTFAKQKLPDKKDDDAGLGNGFVDEFAPDGTLLRRVVSQGQLNSPWGLAVAPRKFGQLRNALLVGNFGDGRINTYDLTTGNFIGTLTDPGGQEIVIDGLWGLDFAPNNRLYFSAGPNDEGDGLLGFIRPAKRSDMR